MLFLLRPVGVIMSEEKLGALQGLRDVSEQKFCFILFLRAIACSCSRPGIQ